MDEDAMHELRYSGEAVYQGAETLFEEGDFFGLSFEECQVVAGMVAKGMKLWFEGVEK